MGLETLSSISERHPISYFFLNLPMEIGIAFFKW